MVQCVMSALPQETVRKRMSAKGQRRTLRRLFDHLVGAIKQRLRHGKSERYYRFNLGPRNGHARALLGGCSFTALYRR